MGTADLGWVIGGIENVILVAAAWSLVYFGKVKLSSPATPKKAAAETAPDATTDLRRAA